MPPALVGENEIGGWWLLWYPAGSAPVVRNDPREPGRERAEAKGLVTLGGPPIGGVGFRGEETNDIVVEVCRDGRDDPDDCVDKWSLLLLDAGGGDGDGGWDGEDSELGRSLVCSWPGMPRGVGLGGSLYCSVAMVFVGSEGDTALAVSGEKRGRGRCQERFSHFLARCKARLLNLNPIRH